MTSELEQMTSLENTTGFEKMLLVYNSLMTPAEYSEMMENITPREAKKISKIVKNVTVTWIWKRQNSRYSPYGWTIVKTNNVITDDNTGEILEKY